MYAAAFSPAPAHLPLVTARLTLRPYEATDEAVFFALLQANRARLEVAFPARLGAVQTSADAGRMLESFAQDWHTKHMFVLGIWDTVGGQYLGDISLKPTWKQEVTAEIGYYLALEAEGRGYAREAVAAAVQFGFGPPIMADRLIIRCRANNPRSCAVAVAAGFRREFPRSRLWLTRAAEGKNEILHFSLRRSTS